MLVFVHRHHHSFQIVFPRIHLRVFSNEPTKSKSNNNNYYYNNYTHLDIMKSKCRRLRKKKTSNAVDDVAKSSSAAMERQLFIDATTAITHSLYSKFINAICAAYTSSPQRQQAPNTLRLAEFCSQSFKLSKCFKTASKYGYQHVIAWDYISGVSLRPDDVRIRTN